MIMYARLWDITLISNIDVSGNLCRRNKKAKCSLQKFRRVHLLRAIIYVPCFLRQRWARREKAKGDLVHTAFHCVQKIETQRALPKQRNNHFYQYTTNTLSVHYQYTIKRLHIAWITCNYRLPTRTRERFSSAMSAATARSKCQYDKLNYR